MTTPRAVGAVPRMAEPPAVDGAPASVIWRFEPFDVDLLAGELRKRQRRIRLQEQPFRILVALLERQGQVVTRQELQARLWPAEVFVDFDNGLNNAVNRLRMALGDSAAAPRFVETVGRRGYRFVATAVAAHTRHGSTSGAHDGESPAQVPFVDPQPGSLGDDPVGREFLSEPVAVPGHAPQMQPDVAGGGETGLRPFSTLPSWLSRSSVVAVALAVLVFATTGSTGRNATRQSDGLSVAGPAAPLAEAPEISGLAILPISDLSVEPDGSRAAFSLSEALTTELARIAPFKVMSVPARESGAPPTQPVPAGVDTVIEGSIARDRSLMHVNMRIVDVRTNRHLWAQTFEGDANSMLELSWIVARAVAGELAPRLLSRPAKSVALSPG